LSIGEGWYGWPAGPCRINAIEPEVAEFQRIHEHIDHANRIALVDPIIEAFRHSVVCWRSALERNPALLPPPIQQENHSIDGVFTQSGPKADIGPLCGRH
jgi:hypothetical protein